MGSPSAALPLSLRGSLTTAASDETHRAMAEALSAADRLLLDCSDVTEVDLSFLQILAATQRAAAAAGKFVALAAPPAGALAEALRRCGFAPRQGATNLSEILTC